MNGRRIIVALALLAPALLAVLVAVIVYGPAQTDGPVAHLLDVALGAVIAINLNVFGFYFGSSHGSREKDRAILEEAGRGAR